MIEPWMTEAVASRAGDFAEQLRTCASGDIAVPDLEWTVAELAQHVASLRSFWQAQHDGGPGFERPADFAKYSDQARAHITTTDPSELAGLIESEFAAYVDTLTDEPGLRWLYGVETSAANMIGLALNELVLHGRDLAAVSGAPLPTFDRRQANLAVDATLVTAPFFVDADKARAQPDGVYHIKFRGGSDYTWTKAGHELRIELGKPDRADARLNANPAVFLMMSLGRYSQVKAALTGAMISYGRKPWRFLGLGNITIDGI